MAVIYGYTMVNSAGWFRDGIYGETDTKLFLSKQECLEEAYKDYKETYKVFLEDEGLIDTPEETKEEFIKESIQRHMAGFIQLSDFHIQYEFFSQELP